MNKEDLVINYISCMPKEEQRKSIEKLMTDIYYAAPSESVVKAFISRRDGEFEFQIRISSVYFSEIVIEHSDRIMLSAVHAKKAILKKMNQWKVDRFEDRAV